MVSVEAEQLRWDSYRRSVYWLVVWQSGVEKNVKLARKQRRESGASELSAWLKVYVLCSVCEGQGLSE